MNCKMDGWMVMVCTRLPGTAIWNSKSGLLKSESFWLCQALCSSPLKRAGIPEEGVPLDVRGTAWRGQIIPYLNQWSRKQQAGGRPRGPGSTQLLA